MSKKIEEKIAVMQHFAAGGKIEVNVSGVGWKIVEDPSWDWYLRDYHIAEEKPAVTKLHCWINKETGAVYHVVPESSFEKSVLQASCCARTPQFDIGVTK